MSNILSESDFKLSLDYISSRIGINLPLTNYNIIRNFITDKLSEKSIDCRRFLQLLDSDKNEFNKFVDAVTINETYFFREEKHFVLLNDIVFPSLAATTKQVNIWSAACSTGEEAISLYLTAENVFGEDGRFRVYGSDVNEEVLGRFQRGIYRGNSFREDGIKFHDLIRRKSETENKSFRIKPEIIEKITRMNVNLSDCSTPVFSGLFDVIFLRNTLIYFSTEMRKLIIDMIVKNLEVGGYLFLSATEMPLISHADLNLIETNSTFYFQKKRIIEKSEQKKITESFFISVKEDNKTEGGAESEPLTEKINPDLVMEHASAKLNNRIFSLVNDPDYDMAVKLIKIMYRINNNEIEPAVSMIDEFESAAGTNPLTFYLKAYTFLIMGLKEQAVEFFYKALAADGRFWPAGFYLVSILMEKKSGETKKILMECISSINEYIENNSYKYQIFLEGFNGKYFLRICEQWLEKI